jgi:hypothetical protein
VQRVGVRVRHAAVCGRENHFHYRRDKLILLTRLITASSAPRMLKKCPKRSFFGIFYGCPIISKLYGMGLVFSAPTAYSRTRCVPC